MKNSNKNYGKRKREKKTLLRQQEMFSKQLQTKKMAYHKHKQNRKKNIHKS